MNINSIHVPRTGGMALRKALIGDQNTGSVKYGDVDITLNGHGTKLGDINGFLLITARDPIERFVSSFNMRFNRDGLLWNFGVKWSDDEQAVFTWYKSANELAEDLLHNSKRAEWAIRNTVHLNTSYWDWFENKDELVKKLKNIVWVGRTKHLNEDFEKLRQMYNLPDSCQLPIDNKNKNHILSPSRFLSKLAITNLEKYLSEEYKFISILEDYFNFKI